MKLRNAIRLESAAPHAMMGKCWLALAVLVVAAPTSLDCIDASEASNFPAESNQASRAAHDASDAGVEKLGGEMAANVLNLSPPG